MTRSMPSARPDGAPSVCLRDDVDRAAWLLRSGWYTREAGSFVRWYYKDKRGSTLETNFDEACKVQKRRDAANKRLAPAATVTPDQRDALLNAALMLISERPNTPKRPSRFYIRWEERIAELLALPEYRAWRTRKEGRGER